MRALSINRATQLVSCVTVLCWLVCCWLIRVCSCVYLFSLVYIISIYSTVLSDSPSYGRHTARTRPSERYFDKGPCPGQRTPHALVAYTGIDGEATGPIAATRLLDLEDEGFERPAECSGRGGATNEKTQCNTMKQLNVQYMSQPTYVSITSRATG